MTDPDAPRGWAARLVRLFWRAYPADFRERYSAEMEAFFDDAWTEARGPERGVLLWKTLSGALKNGALERLHQVESLGGEGMMSGWKQDLKAAFRSLRRRPGFSSVVALTVALGIGAASAVFAVVDGVVLRPVPYPEADRLVSFWTEFDQFGSRRFGLSWAEQFDYAEESRAIEAMGGFSAARSTLNGVGDAQRVSVAWTWGDLFDVIGARTVLGRLPGPEDARSGASPVVVVSYDFWSNTLGGEGRLIGSTLDLDGEAVEVIGVMSPDVMLPEYGVALWRPIARDRADITDRSGHSLDALARLAPGATLETVRTEIDMVHERWRSEWAGQHSPGHPGHMLRAAPLHDRYFGHLKATGLLLVGATGLILLLACANAASLLLARGEVRAADLAVRRALGAGRARIVRYLLVESLLLAAMGGALGIALASVGTDLLLRWEPGALPRVETVGLDVRVTLLAVSMTLLSGLVFGLYPALRGGTLSGGHRRSAGVDRSLSRSLSTLVVGQIGLAIVLLSGAGLLGRSVMELARVDTGIQTEGRLAFSLTIPYSRYPTLAEVDRFWSTLVSEVQERPEFEAAAVIRTLPLRDGVRSEMMRIPGREGAGAEDAESIVYQAVGPGYFEVMEIPLVEGRTIAATDDADAPRVGVINRTAAEAYWPGRSPLGQVVNPTFWGDVTVTIVGVVEDVLSEGARAPSPPELYLPYSQAPASGTFYLRAGTVVATTLGEPNGSVPSARSVVRGLDPLIPLTGVASLEEVEAGDRARERFLTMIFTVFGAISLGIAGMGTYGVVAFAAERRRREYGVRIALGARVEQVVGDVLRGGAVMAAMGAVLGTMGVLLAAPLMEGMLFGVAPRSVEPLLVAPVVMGVIVLIASATPALRVSRTDPVTALRDEG